MSDPRSIDDVRAELKQAQTEYVRATYSGEDDTYGLRQRVEALKAEEAELFARQEAARDADASALQGRLDAYAEQGGLPGPFEMKENPAGRMQTPEQARPFDRFRQEYGGIERPDVGLNEFFDDVGEDRTERSAWLGQTIPEQYAAAQVDMDGRGGPLDEQSEEPTDPVDAVIARIRAERGEEASGALNLVKDMEPERSADVINLAERMGVEYTFADRNKEALERAERQNRNRELFIQNPRLSDWIRNPSNAAVASDSVEELAEIEAYLRGADTGVSNLMRGIGGRGSSLLGGYATTLAVADPFQTKDAETFLELVIEDGDVSASSPMLRTPEREADENQVVNAIVKIRDVLFGAITGERPEDAPQALSAPAQAMMERGQAFKEVDFDYVPGTSWEDVKHAPAANIIPFALEQGIVSTPDMAAAIISLPNYVAARSGKLAQFVLKMSAMNMQQLKTC